MKHGLPLPYLSDKNPLVKLPNKKPKNNNELEIFIVY